MSLKILINNEEVVCNNNISIKEEMLSTSSTILKNCYPKSWEEDKNYTSRYYFPQDYSKCKIIEDSNVMTGKSFKINNASDYFNYKILGDSTGITGLQNINITGKNLFDTSNAESRTHNGITFTLNNDGSIKANGTASSLAFMLVLSQKQSPLYKAGDYAFSLSNEMPNNCYVRFEFYDSNNTMILRKDITTNGTATLLQNCYLKVSYVIASGTVLNNFVNYIQIEKGSTATSYEPYKGNTYEVNLGKNLFDKDNITTGKRLYYWQGTAELIDDANYCVSDYINVNVNSTYTINLTMSAYTRMVFYDNNKNPISVNETNATFTTPNNTAYVRLSVPLNQLDTTQLEKGQATSYSPYFTPIVLNQGDYIYKENTWKTYINGVSTDITNDDLIIQLNSIKLLNGINNINSTCNLELLFSILVFCGCIKNTGNISLNPREPHFVDLQVLDFKCLLSEGETLNYVITGKTIIEAINQVVNSISDYGFIVGNIEILNPNDIINAYSTLNKTAYDVFQYIADITQSRWTTRMLDENTIAIDFYDPTLMPEADPIESTQSYYETNKINDITFNYSTNDYRNKQIMTSDEVYANITQTETIIADGYTQNFTCQNKIGTIESITLNGVNKTFITKNEEELGLTADFIYQPGEMQFSSSTTISSGGAIVITYYPIVKGREIILNSSESTRIETQIGRKGTISRYENRNDTTSSAELQKIGQSYIKYKGQAEITLKVISEKNLFNVGQIVEYQAPLEELSTKYMVKSKTIDWYVSPDRIFYTFELTSNYNYENDINYFDNQRAKSQGNIGEGQVISRNIDLESTALILFYDTEQAEILPTNPTSLDFALDGVLI